MIALPEWITWRQRPGGIIQVDHIPVDMNLMKKLDLTTKALAIAWEALQSHPCLTVKGNRVMEDAMRRISELSNEK